MAEMILPGTYIEVRAEGLTIPGPITVGNLGVVGTANKGPTNKAIILGSLHDARNHFGSSDPWNDGASNELTLVRALEHAYRQGATTVFAVRVAGGSAAPATLTLDNRDGPAVDLLELSAKSEGTWGNELAINVAEETPTSVRVTLQLGEATEVYIADSASALRDALNNDSQWVDAADGTAPMSDLPALSAPPDSFAPFQNGTNGANAASTDYEDGLEVLINEPAHIIVAAGQDDDLADELAAHCARASSDAFQRERIAVVGSGPGATLDDLRGHPVNSDRVIFVGPGIIATDAAASPPQEVTLPGAYTAAAVAGLISAMPAHRSPTNKVLNVGGLETVFNKSELEQLVLNRVLTLEQRQGIKIVKGITSSTDTAWAQITTRRIVDFAKFGVRSAADPFIGKLNNERVRAALKGSISSFLGDMIDREMLTFYDLEVSATRDQEIRGIVEVLMVLQTTFSIDYIRVVMFLQ